jgi:hypothetical protein
MKLPVRGGFSQETERALEVRSVPLAQAHDRISQAKAACAGCSAFPPPNGTIGKHDAIHAGGSAVFPRSGVVGFFASSAKRLSTAEVNDR